MVNIIIIKEINGEENSHYNLDSIKQLIKDSKYRITNSARIDYSRLGFCDDEVIDIILNLKANDLYKSIEAIIISFKERT